jgi:hypothetical protein
MDTNNLHAEHIAASYFDLPLPHGGNANQTIDTNTRVEITPPDEVPPVEGAVVDDNIAARDSADSLGDRNSDTAPEITEEEHTAEQQDAREAEAIADLADIQSRMEECAVCYEDKPLSEVLQMACGNHWLCREHCIELFQRATDTQANYPPQCCEVVGRIELDVVDHWLPPRLIEEYTHKLDEYHTDIRLRCYCSDSQCRNFLPPDSYEDFAEHTFAHCSKCSKSTCVTCKKLVNKDQPHECQNVVVNETNEAYSADMRFKACPFCGRFGQLENACNHVTCLAPSCKGEWCFICLQPWEQGRGHGDCQQYNDPEYDALGYDQNGFHRDTGLDAEGFTRGGYNIQGRNRAGKRMLNFAKRIAPGRSHSAQLLPAFANIGDDEDDLRIGLFMELIAQQERGELAANANLENILNDRLFALGIGRRRGGHNVPPQGDDGSDDEGESEDEEEDDNDEEGEDADGHNPINPQDDGGIQVPDDDEEALEQVVHAPNQETGAVDLETPDDVEERVQEDNMAHDAVAQHEINDGQQDRLEEPTTPLPPPLHQRQCVHAFEPRQGGIVCSVCTERTDSQGMDTFLHCHQCQGTVCIPCGMAYADMIQIYWPGLDDGENMIAGEVGGGEEVGESVEASTEGNVIGQETESGTIEGTADETETLMPVAADNMVDIEDDTKDEFVSNAEASVETDIDGDVAMTDGW